MKVLMLSRAHPPYDYGGGPRVAEYIERYSPDYNIDLTIVAGHPKWKISKEVKDNVIIYRVPSVGSTFLTKIPSFAYSARSLVLKLQKSHDLIYSVASPVFVRADIPFIAHFQSTRFGEYKAAREIKKPIHAFLNKIYIPFDNMLLKKADGVIILSRKMKDEIKLTNKKKTDLKIIPNGVDTDLFRPLGRKRFDSSIKKILYAGRLDARKGIDTLFYAFKRIEKDIKAKLIIAGKGREKDNLGNLADKLSIPVEFLGRIEHKKLPKIYNSADLFVLPSIYEGVPLVALEAMACGTPTITSNACPKIGVPQFGKGNVDKLADLMSDIITSEKRMTNLSQKGIKLSKDYDWRKIILRIIEFFKRFT